MRDILRKTRLGICLTYTFIHVYCTRLASPTQRTRSIIIILKNFFCIARARSRSVRESRQQTSRVLRQAGTSARVLARRQHFFFQTSGQSGRDAVLRPRAGRRTSRLDALRNAVDQRSVAGRHYETTVAAVVEHLLRKIVVHTLGRGAKDRRKVRGKISV